MKLKIKRVEEVEVTHLQVNARVRYWEDATVDGVEDKEGTLIPCREGKSWCPKIELETGKIVNWKQGVTADIHYKVCDDGDYRILDEKGEEIAKKDGYVPETMCPGDEGFGDYIIMKVDENGMIEGWDPDPNDFVAEDTEE